MLNMDINLNTALPLMENILTFLNGFKYGFFKLKVSAKIISRGAWNGCFWYAFFSQDSP